MPTYKPVGIDENSLFPPRVEARLAEAFQVSTNVKGAPYNCIGDGVANDTPGITAALTAAGASGGGTVYFPSGRYKITGITIPAGVTLQGDGPASVLVQSGAPATLISAAGSLGSAVALTVNALFAATTLTVSSTASFVAGDTLLLTDTASYAATDSGYKSGEQVTIKTVTSSTVLALTGPVRGSFAAAGSYTVANGSTVKKINFLTGVGLDSLAIEGDITTTTGLFKADYCAAPSVNRVEVKKGGSIALRFHTCRDATVTACAVHDLTDNVAGSQVGYAVAASGSDDGLTVTGINVQRVRHGFTTMGGADGIPRRIVVSGGTFISCTTSGIDTHAAGDDIKFAENVVVGGGSGITVRSRRTTVSGNQIRLTASHGISCTEEVCYDADIRDNVMSDIGVHGITTSLATYGLTISNNWMNRVGADGIRVDVGSTRVEISGNTVRNVGYALASRAGITSLGTTPATGWIIQRNTVGNDTGIGSVTSAVSAGAGLAGSWVLDNRAFGTFLGTVFNTGGNTSRRNEQIDVALTPVTGSRAGNAALTSLLTVLAAQGIITNSSTA